MGHHRRRGLACLVALCICAGYLGVCGESPASRAQAQGAGPSLSIPDKVAAGSPGTVLVPVRFQPNQSGVAALAFSIVYERACLVLDVAEGDKADSAVSFLAPQQFRGSLLHDVSGSSGRLDIALADYAPPLSTLPNLDTLLEVRFRVVCEPTAGETIISFVRFGAAIPASFSNTLGRRITGSVVDGAVAITRAQATAQPSPGVTPDPGVTPEPVNTAPRAGDDSAGTSEYRSVRIDVLANDVDADNDPLSILEVTQAGLGQVLIQEDGAILYIPEPGRNGVDLFGYVIGDGQGGLSEPLVRVTVSEFNIPPMAQDDIAETDRDMPVTIHVLENDRDQDAVGGAQGLTVFVVGVANHGLTRINPNNTVTYTPTLGFTGETSFRYSIVDTEGGSGVALVTVHVRAVNRPPQIEMPTEVLEYEPGREVLLQIIATDPDGDTNLRYSATGLPPGLAIDPTTGRIVGTIDPDATGNYSVKVVVSDGQSSASIEFTLSVTPEAVRRSMQYMPIVMR